MSDTTPDEIRALLLANPAAALKAVRLSDLKIAGPRHSNGLSSGRTAIDGLRIAVTCDEGNGAFAIGLTIRAAKGESRTAFNQRVDDLWRNNGWILVDEVPGA